MCKMPQSWCGEHVKRPQAALPMEGLSVFKLSPGGGKATNNGSSGNQLCEVAVKKLNSELILLIVKLKVGILQNGPLMTT